MLRGVAERLRGFGHRCDQKERLAVGELAHGQQNGVDQVFEVDASNFQRHLPGLVDECADEAGTDAAALMIGVDFDTGEVDLGSA